MGIKKFFKNLKSLFNKDNQEKTNTENLNNQNTNNNKQYQNNSNNNTSNNINKSILENNQNNSNYNNNQINNSNYDNNQTNNSNYQQKQNTQNLEYSQEKTITHQELKKQLNTIWDILKIKENTQADHILKSLPSDRWVNMDEIKQNIKLEFNIEYKNDKSLYPYLKTLTDINLIKVNNTGKKRTWKKNIIIIEK